ncbi:MAG: hypothetical protein KGR26_15180 [Cyanobacteria bacterium REEB65]|nr:hypothetical protein [Cyanobacteria bacterium REEB65]
MTGTELIAAERKRQIEEEGWTANHDASYHDGELALAGACYAFDVVNGPHRTPSSAWPWDRAYWKPTPNDPIRQLVKAGALIAAEIDRLTDPEAAL